jgi:hypothetical protein
MADETQLGGVKIVVPVNTIATTTQSATTSTAQTRATSEVFLPIAVEWAPAWFYSALAWLGQSYRDASNAQRSFSNYLAGANVDPYQKLGSTRLFVIEFMRNEFFLSIAPDADSEAPLSGANVKYYQRTDAGILQMYKDLSASDIFPFVTHCYVPGKVDLAPSVQERLAEKTVGYDPATGLRRILLGSAMAQVVPAGDFAQVKNEQIYDPTPAIVPLATSLVYDVTTNNAIGAKTFVLPIAYVVDQATPGQFAVNRFGATQAPATGGQAPGFDYGETAIFAGGPGYDVKKATQLTLTGQTKVIMGGDSFITAHFQDSTAYTSISIGNSVVTGVSALTCAAMLPLAAFNNQRIAGFYRNNSWGTSLGFPLFDYQAANSEFQIANTAGAIDPALVYNPSAPFLNGGNLPNVLAKFAAATYIFSPDTLRTMIADAGDYSASGAAAGLSVMSAALKFAMSSNPSAGITDQLTVPVTATVTTTPQTAATLRARRGSRRRFDQRTCHGDGHCTHHRDHRRDCRRNRCQDHRCGKRRLRGSGEQSANQRHLSTACRADSVAGGPEWQYADRNARFTLLCAGGAECLHPHRGSARHRHHKRPHRHRLLRPATWRRRAVRGQCVRYGAQPVRRTSRDLRAAADRPANRRYRAEPECWRPICLQSAGNCARGTRIGRLDPERDAEAGKPGCAAQLRRRDHV